MSVYIGWYIDIAMLADFNIVNCEIHLKADHEQS